MKVELPYFDKKGKEIKQFNLIKVYHFLGVNEQGRGRKHYYMYKWIELKECNGELYFYANHLSGKDSGYFLGVVSNENRQITDCEIIQ